MKFQMIFEGVDRATKVMKKLMSAEKKAADSMKAGAKASENAASASSRATEKMASAWSKVTSASRSAMNAVSAGAKAAARGISALHDATLRLAKSGFGQISSGAGKLFRGFTIVAAAVTSAVGSAALAATSFLGTAKAFESYRIQLETLEGSSAKGEQAMAWIKKFAADTPLELDQVVEAYRNLKTFGLDPTDGTLLSLVDTMAASGKGVEQLEGLTLALGQAWTKEKLQGEEALQLLERGVPVWDILSKKYKKNASELQDMASKGKLGREAITYLIEEIGRRNGGASEKMSRTWEGMLGKLSDLWLQFKLSVMDAGLFDWMKDKLQLLLDTLDKMSADGSLDAWATYVSERIIFVLDNAWSFAEGVWNVLKQLGKYLGMAAEYVGGWENLALVLAGLAFAPVLISTAAGLVQIAMGLSMLTAALLANPIALAIAAIVAGAVAIYVYWEPIKAFFLDLWDSIASYAQRAYNSLVEVIGFDPLGALSKGWSAISSAIEDAWASLPPLEWSDFVTTLEWLKWIHPLQWLELIPGFSWSDVLSGALDWGQYIVSLDWTKYVTDFDWPSLPEFRWPELPTLELPALPDIAGWMKSFGDEAMAAIEGVSKRLGSAWGRVKSAFSWGSDTTALNVADPAIIQAAAEAAAKLSADMSAIAAIDTSGAMGQLAAIENAAKKLEPIVTTAVQQAEAVLAGASFYNHGAALMDTMAAGMRARAAVVVEEIRRTMQQVRDHLPSSPAKTGPLSDIHKLKFGETIAGSIRAQPMVNAMRAASAATMAAAAISAPQVAAAGVSADAARAQVARAATSAPASSSGPIQLTFSPNISIPAGAAGNAADLKAAVQQAMRENAREMADLLEEEMRRRNRRKF